MISLSRWRATARAATGFFALGLAWALAVRQAHAEPPQEPTIREVLVMAQRASRSLGPGRTRELSRRARLSGLIPTLKISAQRGLSQGSSSTSTIDSDRTNASLGDDLTLEASLSFELPRLVFAPEEVRVLSVERWLDNDRRRFLEDVTKLYFQRRRLLHERASAAAPDAELENSIAEAEALLDAFTDGEYMRALERARARGKTGASETPPPAKPQPAEPRSQSSLAVEARAAQDAPVPR
jgi:hypothetical protein